MSATSWMQWATIGTALVASTAAHANRYTLVDLGPVMYDAVINDSDQVAGSSDSNVHHADRAMLWADEQWNRLSKSTSRADAINAHGDVVGEFDYLGGAVLWRRHKHSVQLPLPDGVTEAGAFGINDAGEVVGSYYNALGHGRCYKWTEDAGLVDLGMPAGSDDCIALAINSKGQVTGHFASRMYVRHHAFRYEAGKFVDLGCLTPDGKQPQDFSQGLAINEHGDIVGDSAVHGGRLHAVLWRGKEIIDLHAGDAFDESMASDINDAGVIVGEVWNYGSEHQWTGARFTNPGVVLLDTEVSNLGTWHIQGATGVNRQGNIVAWASGPKGERTVLLRFDSAD